MPEKSLREIGASLKEQYEKGKQAIDRNNFDYAITILSQVLEREPAFFDGRQALRAAQFKKAAASGGGFFRKAFAKTTSTGPLLARAQLALRSNPLEAMNLAEQILNHDPSSAMAHKLLAEAATAAEFPRTAVLSLEIVFKNAPKDRDLAMRLAEALVNAGQIDRAETIYQNLLNLYPDDPDLRNALKDLSARRTMSEGGYDALEDGTGSYRDILRNKEEAVQLEQEHREVKTDDVARDLIAEYEQRLTQEPKNVRLMRSLAELYAQREEYDRAVEYYELLQSHNLGADPSLEKTIAETQLKRFDVAIARVDPREPDHADQVAKLQADRQAFRVAECQKRVERYPTDLQIRFEMGQIYFEAGRVSEAIQEFQKSQANPNRRIQSLYYLGQCFSRRGMNDLAARTYQNAIKEKLVFDDEKKDLIYALGCAYEKLNKAEEAIEQFKVIYETDIGFRDVGAKVDAYYEKQASQSAAG